MSNDGYGSDYAEEYGDSDIPTHFTPSAESFVHDGPRDVGIVFIGDSFVAGYGDPKGHGWVSRVVGRTHHPDLDLTAYNIGVRAFQRSTVLRRHVAGDFPGATKAFLMWNKAGGKILRGLTRRREAEAALYRSGS